MGEKKPGVNDPRLSIRGWWHRAFSRVMISGRKVSATLTFDEVQMRQQKLRALFNKYRVEEQAVSSAQCLKFAEDNGLVDKKVKSSDISMAFSSVKLGKRDTLDFERFEVRACMF